ncbi:MAG: flagellar M-ring protein FliF C-terminal domain-containing protein [Candidatus Tumulicola sp.]
MTQAAQLAARWNALSQPARAGAGAAAALFAVLAVVWAVASHPARTPLFATPLHPEQLGEVEERLAGWNVAFTPLADNVVVAAGRRNDLLLRLSLAGVPHAHVQTTAEALAGVGVLTPQAVIDAQTRTGLAGDIEAGLRGIDGIDDARVIVAPAKTAEFADESSRDASASVRVRLRTGSRLARDAVAGIRAFVAAGVPGLTPERVTILDDRGVALGDDNAGAEAGDLQGSLQTALDAAFGEGATVVRVRAEYNRDRNSERDVRRAPLEGAGIGRAARIESLDDGGKRYRRRDESEDRGSETRELVTESGGATIRRLTTAVFLDVARGLDAVKVRDLASATVGYDAGRGDSLVVQAVDFRHDRVARKDAWWLLYGAVVPLLPVLAVTGAALFAARAALPGLTSLLRAVVERSAIDRTAKAVAGFAPARVRSVLAQEPPHAAAAIISALPAATAAAVLDMYPQHEREAIVKRMARPHSPLIGDATELLRRHG